MSIRDKLYKAAVLIKEAACECEDDRCKEALRGTESFIEIVAEIIEQED